MDNLIKINRFCLYLLVFAACFEYWDPFGFAKTISIAKIGTIPYFISSLPFLKDYLRFSFLSRYLVPLLIFILAGIFATTINDQYADSVFDIINDRLVQLVLLMVLIAAHIYLDNKVLSGLLKVYVAGMFVMSILFILGIGEQYKGGRLLLFGENANQTGMKCALSLIIIIYEITRKNIKLRIRIFNLIIIIPILNLLISSGSRGALLSLIIGVFLFIMFGKISVVRKIGLGLVALLFSASILVFIYNNDRDFRIRIERSIEKGDTAGRTELWEAAYRIIEDNVIFGVGNPGMMPAMRLYSGINQQPHNLFLELWLTSGIIGLIFFMIFLLRVSKTLMIRIKQDGNVLYFSLFVVVLLNVVKSGGGAGLIFAWIFFGIIIGSTMIPVDLEVKELKKK